MDRYAVLLAFLERAYAFTDVKREIYLSDGRKENDAEHTWHMMLWILLFAKEEPGLDMLRAFELALVHDLPEILTGDISAFDEAGRVGKQERELAAAEELFAMLPNDLRERFTALYDEYELCESREAQFVRSIDKLQPLLVNIRTQGRSWHQSNISSEQMDAVKRPFMQDALSLKVYERLLAQAQPLFPK